MTRFARARGSNGSNDREPEEATSWSTMKRQLEESKIAHINPEESTVKADEHNFEHLKSLIRPNRKTEYLLWEEFNVPSDNNATSRTNHSNNKDSRLCHSLLNKNNSSKVKSVKSKKNETSVTDCSGKSVLETKDNTFIVDSRDANNVNGDKQTTTNKHFKDGVSGAKIIKMESDKKKTSKYECFERDSIDEPTIEQSNKNSKVGQKRQFKSCVLKNTTKEENTFVPQRNEIKHETHDIIADSSSGEIKNKRMKYSSNITQENYKYKGFDRENPQSKYFGTAVEHSYFQGFPVKKEDAERLSILRRELRCKGVPRDEIESVLFAERRRAEKALARSRKVICYKCRQFGHSMSDCVELADPSGICFKCGSTEHTVKECSIGFSDSFKFARCFICQEQGHISRQCPDNPRGIYPQGGGCNLCGDVTHYKRDCPQHVNEKEKRSLTVGVVNNSFIEGLDEDLVSVKQNNPIKKSGVVKF